jgi:hypothetical protein
MALPEVIAAGVGRSRDGERGPRGSLAEGGEAEQLAVRVSPDACHVATADTWGVNGAGVDESAWRAKTAAMVLLALGVAFYLMFAVGEMAGGDLTGIQHVPPALVLGALLGLAWKRPYTAGVVLLVLAVPLGAAYIALLFARDLPPSWALFVVLPPIVTGVLLVRAGRGERGLR